MPIQNPSKHRGESGVRNPARHKPGEFGGGNQQYPRTGRGPHGHGQGGRIEPRIKELSKREAEEAARVAWANANHGSYLKTLIPSVSGSSFDDYLSNVYPVQIDEQYNKLRMDPNRIGIREREDEVHASGRPPDKRGDYRTPQDRGMAPGNPALDFDAFVNKLGSTSELNTAARYAYAHRPDSQMAANPYAGGSSHWSWWD